MISLRNLTRSLPRLLARPSLQTSSRTLTALCKPSALQQSWRVASRPACAAFSISSTLRTDIQEGQVDQELSAKLEKELQLEQEMSESDDLPPNLKEFLDNSPFQIHDTPGEEEVVLTRSFGNEKIRITFSIADLNSMDQDPDQYSEDKALYDEDGDDMDTDMQQGGAQSKSTIDQVKGKNINVTPEDSVAGSDLPELRSDEATEPEEDQEPSFPARINVTIEKNGAPGAMQIETVAQDGMVNIENVYYFAKAELADAKTADQDWSRRLMYTGPPYGNLDQDLQLLLEKFLDERGINTALALWVPEYIDFKEQREYLKWLSDVKTFVDT